MPENDLLPNAWWLFWWGVGLLVTIVLALWFVAAARRAQRPAAGGARRRPTPAGEPRSGGGERRGKVDVDEDPGAEHRTRRRRGAPFGLPRLLPPGPDPLRAAHLRRAFPAVRPAVQDGRHRRGER